MFHCRASRLMSATCSLAVVLIQRRHSARNISSVLPENVLVVFIGLVPSLAIPFALQRDLSIHLPVFAVTLRFRAMPQHADKSSGVDAILLLHRSAAIKTLN